jgi:ferredoxin
MALIQPELTEDIKKYGTFDFAACFNCGNCTAACNLTEENANFPRKMIRYSMLGLKDEILSSKELWLCFACGDCSTTCPRQAEPGDLMASLRRFAIANYEKSGLTKMIFKSNPFSLAVTLILSVVLGFFLLTIKPDMAISRWIFKYIPYEVIHTIGILAFVAMGLSAISGAVVMWRKIAKNKLGKSEKGFFPRFMEAHNKLMVEAATMKRYKSCDSDSTWWNAKNWYVRPWFVHWSIMWGFIGLLLATTLDFLFKDPSTDIWWPSRILGTMAGLLMIYGASLALYYRLVKTTKSYANTRLADWMFLSFLWLAGITGFWLEISVTFTADVMLTHIVFIIHTIISMQLVILFAFSKFAHALYRSIALIIHYY